MSSAVEYLDNPPLHRYGTVPALERGVSPAAGAEFSTTIDGRYFVRLITVFCRLVTDANVADRQVSLQYLDEAGNPFAIMGAPVTQAAATTTDYAWQAWLGQPDWPVSGTVLIPLAQVILQPPYSWKIDVDNVQATDALTRVRYLSDRFYTGAPPS